MKARELRPGDLFTVSPSDPESPVRMCRTNSKEDGLQFGWPNNPEYWCYMGGEVEVQMKLHPIHAFRELLAAYAHTAWSGWMKYLFRDMNGMRGEPPGSWTINPELVERWRQQMTTPYAKLSEDEKVSDQHEADEILEFIGHYIYDPMLDTINALRQQLADGLLSMDATWEEGNEGHDWADWCSRTRRLLEEVQNLPDTTEWKGR